MVEIVELMQLVNTFGVPSVLLIWLISQQKHYNETLGYYRRKEAFYLTTLIQALSNFTINAKFEPEPDDADDTLPTMEPQQTRTQTMKKAG